MTEKNLKHGDEPRNSNKGPPKESMSAILISYMWNSWLRGPNNINNLKAKLHKANGIEYVKKT